MNSSSLDQVKLDQLEDDLGSRDALLRIGQLYLGRLDGELEEIQASLQEGDGEAIAQQAHRLKSSTAMLGATTLAELLGELEAAGSAGDVAGARELASRLGTEAESARTALVAALGD